MIRRLFKIAALLSLLLYVTTCAIWYRSYVDPNHFRIWHNPAKELYQAQDWFIYYSAGRFSIIRHSRYPNRAHLRVYAKIYCSFVAAFFSALPLFWAVVWTRNNRRMRSDPTLCFKCGYDLRATPERCPECGDPAKLKSANGFDESNTDADDRQRNTR